MIGFIKRWIARLKHEKKLKICREDGHILERSGEMTPAKSVGGVPVPTGPAEFWLFSCKCGYSEINDVGTASPYRRDFLEGERLKKTQGVKI